MTMTLTDADKTLSIQWDDNMQLMEYMTGKYTSTTSFRNMSNQHEHVCTYWDQHVMLSAAAQNTSGISRIEVTEFK